MILLLVLLFTGAVIMTVTYLVGFHVDLDGKKEDLAVYLNVNIKNM
jgi:hypothetical protein